MQDAKMENAKEKERITRISVKRGEVKKRVLGCGAWHSQQ
jgi:hypothetical protein